MSDWEITLNDQTDSEDDIDELDTFQLNGLNERYVELFWRVYLLNI